MALRQLILTKRMQGAKSQLDGLRAKDAEFATRKETLKTREAEIEAAVNEITDETPAEDKTAVDETVAAFEADQNALETEQGENETAKKKLEDEIRDLQKELDEVNNRAANPATNPEAPEKREDIKHMSNRTKFFSNMASEARAALITRTDVKEFLTRARGFIGQKRAVTGAELTIPEVLLETLRDNLHRYSKLVNYINVRQVNGKARQNVMGTIPEAIWTEACGKLNELIITFAQVEVDGFKVGGFVPVCNSTLEDSDENLAAEIMDALGQALGYATDKAVLFGTGTKMPLGIATRLAQTAEPSDWNDNAPAWTDLHATHVLKIDPSGMTAEAFFAALVLDLGVADNKYAMGNTFWAMNRKTRMALMSKMINFNAAGALVAGMNNTMPVEGGSIVELPFMADNDIIGGFGSLYLLAERSGAQLAQSEHVMFIEDQTVFRGTARYDGLPVFGEAFVAVNIANAAPTTSVLFPQDVANTVATPRALPIAGEYTGAQSVALTCDTAGATIYYTVDDSTPDATKTAYNGPIAVAATKTIKAIAIKAGMTNSAILSAAYTIGS
jgi:HK97 family phage major capsid protein